MAMSRLSEAFEQVDRRFFLPEDSRELSGADRPVDIGYGQTNSQPDTVRLMLEWLDPQPGDKVLDIGSGSGWTTALLAHLVGTGGRVYAVERVPELLKFGEHNCQNQGLKNVRFFPAEKSYGLVKHAPYDRILVSAAAEDIPQELLDQLKLGGRMVIPVNHCIHIITKYGEDDFEIIGVPGFTFVPLVPPADQA